MPDTAYDLEVSCPYARSSIWSYVLIARMDLLMSCSLLILAGSPELPASTPLAAAKVAFLRDTLDLVAQLRGTQTSICRSTNPSAALHSALATGPAILLTADTPHLPIWRLRDAITLLANTDLVVGSCERADWYLLGLRTAHPGLLQAIPALGDDPAALIATARSHNLSVATLAPWYRVITSSDLDQFLTSVRTMPTHVAAHTRALFANDGLHSRALGG